jgi:hypothetical protein
MSLTGESVEVEYGCFDMERWTWRIIHFNISRLHIVNTEELREIGNADLVL